MVLRIPHYCHSKGTEEVLGSKQWHQWFLSVKTPWASEASQGAPRSHLACLCSSRFSPAKRLDTLKLDQPLPTWKAGLSTARSMSTSGGFWSHPRKHFKNMRGKFQNIPDEPEAQKNFRQLVQTHGANARISLFTRAFCSLCVGFHCLHPNFKVYTTWHSLRAEAADWRKPWVEQIDPWSKVRKISKWNRLQPFPLQCWFTVILYPQIFLHLYAFLVLRHVDMRQLPARDGHLSKHPSHKSLGSVFVWASPRAPPQNQLNRQWVLAPLYQLMNFPFGSLPSLMGSWVTWLDDPHRHETWIHHDPWV